MEEQEGPVTHPAFGTETLNIVNPRETVAYLFWLQMMEVKEALLVFKNLDLANRWIKAIRCKRKEKKIFGRSLGESSG